MHHLAGFFAESQWIFCAPGTQQNPQRNALRPHASRARSRRAARTEQTTRENGANASRAPCARPLSSVRTTNEDVSTKSTSVALNFVLLPSRLGITGASSVLLSLLRPFFHRVASARNRSNLANPTLIICLICEISARKGTPIGRPTEEAMLAKKIYTNEKANLFASIFVCFHFCSYLRALNMS